MLASLFSCHNCKNFLRASSVRITAPFSFMTKSFACICLRLKTFKTNRSAIKGLNSSMTSKARDDLPGRSRCNNPTYESSPTHSKAAAVSESSKEYEKDSKAFIRSNGDRRFRCENVK